MRPWRSPARALVLIALLAAAGSALAQEHPSYEDAGRIKFGDYDSLEAYRKELKGFRPTSTIVFWNVWLETR